MKLLIYLSGAVSTLAFFCGCSKCEDYHLTNEQVVIIRIYSKGNLIRESSISGATPMLEDAKKIIENKNGKWKTSLVSYAPLYEIKGHSFSVNFQAKRIIVNYKNAAGKYNQLVSNLSTDEFERIKTAIELDTPTNSIHGDKAK